MRNNRQNSYDLNWKPLINNEIANITKPEHLDKMITLARTLSSPFEFVRIDFYYVGGIIYFSEFTFTPAGGKKFFSTIDEERFGSMWV
jgi:hypothetical protein